MNKSSCVDTISSRVMKDAFIHLNEKFTFLINKSLSLGIFPNEMCQSLSKEATEIC